MKTEIYWIEETLAILMRPRGGDWLADEIVDWKREGIGVVVSLLARDEVSELGVEREARMCRNAGLDFHWLPVNDLSVPASMLETVRLVTGLAAARSTGKKIGIHCRQGLGRAPLLTACLLVQAEVPPPKAWQKISAARGITVPETDEQREWLNRFADELQTLNA